MTQHNVC